MFKKHLSVVACVFVLAGICSVQGLAQSASPVIVIPEDRHDVSGLGPQSSSSLSPNTQTVRSVLYPHAPGPRSAVPDSVRQTSVGPSVSTTLGASFLGVGEGLGSFSVTSAPPDTNGTPGPTQYVQWVNTSFAVFDKASGSVVYGPVAGNSIWSGFGGQCQAHNDGDITAQYDKQAQRWVMEQPVFESPYTICIAVSTGSTWTSNGMNWYRYSFQVPSPSTNFPDYPKLAVWPDGYYLAFNSFSSGSFFLGPQACALDRNSILNGLPATMQCFPAAGNGFSFFLPSDLDGAIPGVSGATAPPPAGSPAYYVGLNGNTSSSTLYRWKFHVDWTTPANSTFTGPTNIPVASYQMACGGGTCVPQSGTSEQLDSLGDRVMYRLAYRNFGDHEALALTHSVDTGHGNTGIRWYEIRNPGGTPTVFQQSTYSPDNSIYRWMGSIAQDKFGDMAVGYSESNSAMHPAIEYTGRLSTDPVNTMQSEASIVAGGGSQLANLDRWGDYTAMAIDPTDDCTFWYTNEFLLANGTFNWSTQIASFSFPGCSGTATPGFTLSETPLKQSIASGSSTSYAVFVTPYAGFGSSSPQVTLSTGPLPPGVGVTFSSNPVTLSGTSPVPVTVTVTTSTSTPAGTDMLIVTGVKGSLTSQAGLMLVVTGPPPPSFTLTATPTSRAITARGSTNYTVNVNPSNGFTGVVTLTITSTLPTGMGITFSPNNQPNVTGPSSVPTTMNVTTTTSTPAGTYTIKVKGTAGTLSAMTQVSLRVNPAPVGTITVSANPPSLTIARGSNGTSSITVTGAGGFSGMVTLTLSGLPPRVTPGWTPANRVTLATNGSASTTLKLVVGTLATPGGPFPITITGKDSSGTITNTTTLFLTIN